jgi:hypothetical protein
MIEIKEEYERERNTTKEIDNTAKDKKRSKSRRRKNKHKRNKEKNNKKNEDENAEKIDEKNQKRIIFADRFEISPSRMLGKGSFGEIYIAIDRVEGGTCALKLVFFILKITLFLGKQIKKISIKNRKKCFGTD